LPNLKKLKLLIITKVQTKKIMRDKKKIWREQCWCFPWRQMQIDRLFTVMVQCVTGIVHLE